MRSQTRRVLPTVPLLHPPSIATTPLRRRSSRNTPRIRCDRSLRTRPSTRLLRMDIRKRKISRTSPSRRILPCLLRLGSAISWTRTQITTRPTRGSLRPPPGRRCSQPLGRPWLRPACPSTHQCPFTRPHRHPSPRGHGARSSPTLQVLSPETLDPILRFTRGAMSLPLTDPAFIFRTLDPKP